MQYGTMARILKETREKVDFLQTDNAAIREVNNMLQRVNHKQRADIATLKEYVKRAHGRYGPLAHALKSLALKSGVSLDSVLLKIVKGTQDSLRDFLDMPLEDWPLPEDLEGLGPAVPFDDDLTF